jgi:hypothetical protein
MLLTLYVLFAITGFLSFFIAVFLNKEIANIFVWPLAVIVFAALFFGSYNIQTGTTVVSSENVTIISDTQSYTTYNYDEATTYFSEPALSWMFLGLSLLSVLLFIWDLFNHIKETIPKDPKDYKADLPSTVK